MQLFNCSNLVLFCKRINLKKQFIYNFVINKLNIIIILPYRYKRLLQNSGDTLILIRLKFII